MKRDIVLQRDYAHPPEIVWRALTEPDLIARWLMTNDFRAEVGCEFQFKADAQPGWDGIVHCRVLELEPLRRLRYSWVGGPLDTEVSFTLTPNGRGTHLRVEHTGFDGFKPMLVSFIMGAGWGRMYKKAFPQVLDAIAHGRAPAAASESCHDRGVWRAVVALFSPILKSGTKR